jgi:hypothetical protein
MLKNTLREIEDRILKEKKNDVLIELKLIFHNGEIQKYHYSKKYKSIITQSNLKEDKDE